MHIASQNSILLLSYYCPTLNQSRETYIWIGFSIRFNGADKIPEFMPTLSHINDLYAKVVFSTSMMRQTSWEEAIIPYFLWGLSHLILQILYKAIPMSLLFSPGSPPWLGYPCRGSCTLETWDHSCTSNHCPCRQTHPLHCRLCSWEQPAQNFLLGSLVGSLASL